MLHQVKERNADYHRIISTVKSKAPIRWQLKESKKVDNLQLSVERTDPGGSGLSRKQAKSVASSPSWLDQV